MHFWHWPARWLSWAPARRPLSHRRRTRPWKSSFYTENAVRITPEAGKTIGRSAIEKEFVANFAGPWKGAMITINVGSIQHVNADVAVNEGTYEVTGIRTPDGNRHPP